MSANPDRRRLLGLFAAAPIAAVAGVQPASALGRVRGMALNLRADDHASAVLGRIAGQVRGPGIPGISAAIERAHPLDRDMPPTLGELVSDLDANPAGVLAQQAAEARTIAALALVYPPEIAAYRSFGAPMRRRLYAELLTRQSARLVAVRCPPREDTP
jgi:hypothetical protein